jgi:hypothetical protein
MARDAPFPEIPESTLVQFQLQLNKNQTFFVDCLDAIIPHILVQPLQGSSM